MDKLHDRGIPRGVGVLLHDAVLATAVAALLWAVVPRALDQVQSALGDLPATRSELRQEARESTGFRQQALTAVEHRLERLPRPEDFLDEGAHVGLAAFELFVGIFFVLATGAYWTSSGSGPRTSSADSCRASTPRPCATPGG